MKILEKNKNYNVLDFIRIPMKVCPICTIVIIFNRIIAAIVPALNVIVTAGFIDTALEVLSEKQGLDLLVPYIVAYIMIILYSHFQNVLIFNFINIRYDMKMLKKLQGDILDKTATIKYEHMENSQDLDLIERVTTNPLENIARGMNNCLDIIDLIIRFGTLVAIVFAYVWWSAIIICIAIVIIVKCAMHGGKDIYNADRRTQEYSRYAGYLSYLQVGKEFVDERSVFGYSNLIMKRWNQKYEYVRKETLKVAIKNLIYLKIYGLFTIIISAIIMIFLIVPLKEGIISGGLFISISSAIFEVVFLISGNLSDVTKTYAQNIEYLADLTEFMGMSEQDNAALSHKKTDIFVESIEFKNVFFKYPGTDEYVLNGISFNLNRNKKYAFVGINGAGKTTIVKLLIRLYDDYDGSILINGKDIREYNICELKSMISVSFQDFAIYYIKAKENIIIGNIGDINKEQLEKAISFTGVDNIFAQLPEGDETDLGRLEEKGVDLSMGQWQRVALARTVYSQAQIKILDEPTASLDPIEESEIYNIFSDINKEAMTILITHRLGAARLSDEIIVLNNGIVAEQGTHNDLMKKGGIYADMFTKQSIWYKNEEVHIT